MAGITSYSGGHRRITFRDAHGERKSLRLGKVDRATAELVAGHIETLVGCQLASSGIPRATATWLASIAAPLREKLAGVGLIDSEKRKKEEDRKKAEAKAKANSLGAFLMPTSKNVNRSPALASCPLRRFALIAPRDKTSSTISAGINRSLKSLAATLQGSTPTC